MRGNVFEEGEEEEEEVHIFDIRVSLFSHYFIFTVRRTILPVPNQMQMSKTYCSSSFALENNSNTGISNNNIYKLSKTSSKC